MLGRLLLWVLGAVALWWWLRRRQAPPPPRPTGPSSSPESVVPCARCGLLVPRGATLADDSGRLFCSQEHQVQGPTA